MLVFISTRLYVLGTGLLRILLERRAIGAALQIVKVALRVRVRAVRLLSQNISHSLIMGSSIWLKRIFGVTSYNLC